MALLMALYHGLKEMSSCYSQGTFDLITALHFNHQIHPDSDSWQSTCEQCCAELQINFYCSKWSQVPGQVINEGNARDARYRWFSEVVESDQVLLTAHHADDQAETVMMHLFQGHGLTRLQGIPPVRPLNFGETRKIYRPLLGFPRDSLQGYLEDIQRQWINDPTNQDLRITRNYVRAQLMPLIKKRWPNALESIASSVSSLSRVSTLVDQYLERSLADIEAPDAKRIFCLLPPLKIEPLLACSQFEFCQLLRRWIHKAGLPAPTEAQLGSLHQQLREHGDSTLSPDSKTNFLHCKLHWKHLNVVSYGRYLYVFKDITKPPSHPIASTTSPQNLPNGLTVKFREAQSDGITAKLVRSGEMMWCWRKGGEKVILPGRDHRSSLKKILQQARVPEWERDSLPFLVYRGEIVWVNGIGVSQNFSASGNDTNLLTPYFSTIRTSN